LLIDLSREGEGSRYPSFTNLDGIKLPQKKGKPAGAPPVFNYVQKKGSLLPNDRKEKDSEKDPRINLSDQPLKGRKRESSAASPLTKSSPLPGTCRFFPEKKGKKDALWFLSGRGKKNPKGGSAPSIPIGKPRRSHH